MRAKDIAPAERDEVRGFIKDMESLKRPSAPAVAPAPAAPAAAPVAAPLPAPVAVPPPAPAAQPFRPEPASAGPLLPVAPAPDSVAASAIPAVSGTAPPPSRGGVSGGRMAGGVMVGVAGLAALGGGIALASSWSAYNAAKASGGGCKLPYTDCEQARKKVETRNLLSKILLVGAAIIGVTGVTIMVVSPATSGETASGEATGSGFLIASHGNF